MFLKWNAAAGSRGALLCGDAAGPGRTAPPKPESPGRVACPFADAPEEVHGGLLILRAEGLGYTEIAESLSLNPVSVGTLLSEQKIWLDRKLSERAPAGTPPRGMPSGALWDSPSALRAAFWATWCPPCREEIPWFVGFHRTYSARGFPVIGKGGSRLSTPAA
ncbi:MAG: hypothetical protein SFV51_30080 [Bryobacteraceae bacterium]|nr:hypothetical protein [Bryobacteraceae bacterium]